MQLFTKFLLIAVPAALLQVLTSMLVPVGAAPVPAPAPTQHAIAHSHSMPPPNQQHAAQVRLQTPHVAPTITHAHPSGEHVHGTLPVHHSTQLDHNGHMQPGKLEAHAHHIAESLDRHPVHGNSAHGWQVHAQHDPHSNQVHFQAVQKHEGTPNEHHAQLPALHKHQSEHAVRNPHEHQTTLNHLHTAQQNGQHEHGPVVRDHVNGDHMSGRLHVPEHLRAPGAMTPDHLESHAHYVANHVIKHPQGSNLQVSVQHHPGSGHVDYHVQAHPGGTINPHLPATVSQAHSVKWHLEHGANVPKPLPGSVNQPHESPAFKGAIPKHHTTPEHASVGHLEAYSSAIRTNLNTNHMQNHRGHDLAVASMQTPDRTGVMYRTPRHLPKSEAAGEPLHPYVQGHINAVAGDNQAKRTEMGSHAEMHLVSDYLHAAGATEHDAHHHLAGRTIGIAGQGNQPCGQNCHQVLGRMGVDYAGRERRLRDEGSRAIPLYQRR